MSFKNLFIHSVVRFMFREVSQTSLGLEKAGLDSGFSPAACCQVEVEAEGRSELWWSVWSWGQWTPSSLEGQEDPLCGAWRDLTGSVFRVSLSF